MADVELPVVVHGLDSHVVPQVLSEKSSVDHVELKSVVHLNVNVAKQTIPCILQQKEKVIGEKGDFCTIKIVLLLLTLSRLSQASLLGANKVKEPLPSIFSLIPDLSVYSWVVRALTSSRVPYTWSMGATTGSTDKGRMLCVHCQESQTVVITHAECCGRTCTCRTSSHAVQLHVPRTAIIEDLTLTHTKKEKREYTVRCAVQENLLSLLIIHLCDRNNAVKHCYRLAADLCI